MVRKITLLAVCLVCVLGFFTACGEAEDAGAMAEAEAERAAQLEAIEEADAELNAKAERIAEINAQLSPAPAEEGEEVEALTAEERAALREELAAAKDEYYEAAFETGNLAAEFVNTSGLAEGEEMPEDVRRAIEIKSDADIAMAQEHIEKGGDYPKAISIYDTALLLDPENEKLLQAKEEAENARWMTEDRFTLAKEGMTEAEVRSTVGPPLTQNIQEYPDKQAKAWFYKKGEDGSAAAIYFRQKNDGPYLVYQTDFNAVKARGAEEG